MSIDQYSTTPTNNDLVNYFKTGMRPSAVKNAGWDIMADIASAFGLPNSTGSANAQAIANGRPYGALVAGVVRGVFIPGFTNTGAMTLAIDGLTATNCYANGSPIIAGMVVSGVLCYYVYDGTHVVVLNPQRSSGSATLTVATGLSSTPTFTLNYYVGQDGKTVYANIPSGNSGVSNATTMTLTGIPPIIQPTSSKNFVARLEDNSIAPAVSQFISTGTSGTWTPFLNVAGTGGFTASGIKGVLPFESSFTLD